MWHAHAGYWYVLAGVLAAAAWLVRWLLDPLLEDHMPFGTFFVAVAATAWLGGIRPTVLVSLVGLVAGSYSFVPPRHTLLIADRQHLTGLALYIVACATLGAVGEAVRRARHRAEQLAEQLREADRRKDAFLATLAHELRNPLAPVCNSLQIIRRAKGDPVLIDRAVATAERQVSQLVRLVDDLLDVSRITRDKLELRKETVELRDIVDQAIEACRPLAQHRRQTIEVALPAAPVRLRADAARLAQVIGNLVHNACKYSHAGGTIRVSAAREGGDAVIRVTDEGMGIPKDMLEKVFDLFAQVDRPAERSQGGLGIGLSLVKRLVEMHGGAVTARSEGQDLGTEIVVRLPAPPDEAGDAGEPVQKEVVAPMKTIRILVVDDNIDAAESLAELLELSGGEVRLAKDGVEAVEVAADLRPHVILMDLGLPRMDGYEACRRIRAEPWGKGILIAAITGWGQDQDRARSTEAGFDTHLVKPVEFSALESLLAGVAP